MVIKRQFLSALLMVSMIVSAFLLYANVLKGEFMWDDFYCVQYNHYITDWHHLGDVVMTSAASGVGERTSFYRPLQMITYMIDYSFWGFNVIGYHLTNMILHLCVALVLFYLLQILFKDLFLSFLASSLFLVHPVHTAAVSYIAGRADILSALWILLCFVFYIRQRENPHPWQYGAMIVSCLLALFSKEYSMIIPLLLLFYHGVFGKRLLRKEFSTIIAVITLYALLRMRVVGMIPYKAVEQTSFFERLPGFFAALSEYARLLIAPFDLHMGYGLKVFHYNNPQVFAGMAIITVAGLAAYFVRKKNTLVLFSILWFFVMLLPHANLYPINAYMAEHWLYMPSIGFFLLCAYGVRLAGRMRLMRVMALSVYCAVIIFYALITIRHNVRYWVDFVRFCEITLRYSPDNAMMYNNLGNALSDKGRYNEAAEAYKKALLLQPQISGVYVNLADAYRLNRHFKEAVSTYQIWLSVNPDDLSTYYKLIEIFKITGEREKEAAAASQVASIKTKLMLALLRQADALRDKGEYKKAVLYYQQAQALSPQGKDILDSLSATYILWGKPSEARKYALQALLLAPDSALSHHQLAVAYYYAKQYNLAVSHSDRSQELGFDIPKEFLQLLQPYRKGDRILKKNN